jgi:hypothetical protein
LLKFTSIELELALALQLKLPADRGDVVIVRVAVAPAARSPTGSEIADPVFVALPTFEVKLWIV